MHNTHTLVQNNFLISLGSKVSRLLENLGKIGSIFQIKSTKNLQMLIFCLFKFCQQLLEEA
ncbi:hypothetical protein BpHYR1_013752 [Brachionus plicatilis]|uniref:Uncharacterized protein n=1 Tax=Brachionus plicatilis TaxID=10195 RepID=A0A3M7PAE4_BRAPC|nr:hypothetical protein BpHYR1_013752 [Brachionus plicatilis]